LAGPEQLERAGIESGESSRGISNAELQTDHCADRQCMLPVLGSKVQGGPKNLTVF